jgi:WhiB family redox-sensing transcriptional regulator
VVPVVATQSAHAANLESGLAPRVPRTAEQEECRSRGASNNRDVLRAIGGAHLQDQANSTYWSWQSEARCRGMPADTFYVPDYERGRARRAREDSAKRICQSCGVMERCRAYALAAAEPYGIWGGTTPSERVFLAGGTPRGWRERASVVATT